LHGGQAHAPALLGVQAGSTHVGLFDDGETPNVRGPGVNSLSPSIRRRRSEVFWQVTERMGQQALRRIRRAWVLFVLSGLAFLYAGQGLAQELRRIHYGTTTSTAHLPIWAAKDAGLFAKNGLNVEPVQIRGGALITMGIMSGQLQFSGAGAESVVSARIEGGDVVLLACPVDSDLFI
jgi:hypothetical protein